MGQTIQKIAVTPVHPMPSPRCADTLIVIPAFNEANNIGAIIDEIQNYTPGVPILVIDDGSSDGTAQTAKDHGALVISLLYNSGYGVALQTGFIYAVQNNYKVVIQMDGDRQHHPGSRPDLLREIQKDDVDVVIGSRFLGAGAYKNSFARSIGISLFRNLTSFIIGKKITDPTSGYQAIKGKAIEFIASDFYPPDYPDADFIILLNRVGFNLREIPVVMRPNMDNRSMHHGHKTVYYVFKMFLSIIVTLLRKTPSVRRP